MNEVLLIAIPAAGFTSTVIALACCVAAGRADKNLRPLGRTQEGTGAGAATVRGRRVRAERAEGIEAGWLAWKARAERAEAELRKAREALEKIAADPKMSDPYPQMWQRIDIARKSLEATDAGS